MPYLIRIGFYSQKNNYTSQGYFIKLSGKKVITKWGAIYVLSNPNITFFWKWYKPREKTYLFGTEKKSQRFFP